MFEQINYGRRNEKTYQLENHFIELIDKFYGLDDEKLKKYGIDDDHWIPEDYYAGFNDAIEGLKQYLKEGCKR